MGKSEKNSSKPAISSDRDPLLGENAEIIEENMELVDMEEMWFEGPTVVDNAEPESRKFKFLI